MDNPNLKEMLKSAGEYSTESQLNYLIYRVLTGNMDREDLEIFKQVSKAFSDAGDEGVNFEDYMLYTKFNIYTGQTDIFNSLIDQIESQLNENLLLPEDDIFSIYKGVSILESLANRKPQALDNIMEILRMIKDSDVDLSALIEGLSANFVDNIHLRDGNLYLLQNLNEMGQLIKSKDQKDKFWSTTLSKLILRKEDTPTLNSEIVKFVEENLQNISKEEDKLGIYYGLTLSYYEQFTHTNSEELKDKMNNYQEKLAESLPTRSSQTSKLYRDVLMARLKAIMGDDFKPVLKKINERMRNISKINRKEDVDAASYIISSGLSHIIKHDDSREIIDTIHESISKASEIIRIWSMIDLYTKLNEVKRDEADNLIPQILEAVNNLGEEKHEVLEDWLTNGLAESYAYNPNGKILNILKQISEMEGQHPDELLANFFSSLSYFAESNKHILNFSS